MSLLVTVSALNGILPERIISMEWQAYELFWKGYLTSPLTVASVAPDSKWCVDALLRHTGVETADVILEFGSASGAVTRKILARKKPSALLVCVEMNGSFVDLLTRGISDKNCHIAFQSIFDSDMGLRNRGIADHNVDCIVSTLPCSNIPFDQLIRERILPYLKPNGVFVQYMHALSFLRGMYPRRFLEPRFHRVSSEFVARNMPPAVVYTCTRARREKAPRISHEVKLT